MAHLFLQLQHVVLVALMLPERKHQMIKVNLEWDETGQAMQLRRGLIRVNGVMPVLVPCLKNLFADNMILMVVNCCYHCYIVTSRSGLSSVSE